MCKCYSQNQFLFPTGKLKIPAKQYGPRYLLKKSNEKKPTPVLLRMSTGGAQLPCKSQLVNFLKPKGGARTLSKNTCLEVTLCI